MKHAPDCAFCKVLAGELPSYKLYEDGHYNAILDINPVVPGQALVIPKAQDRWVWDHDDIGEYFKVAGKIANAQRKAFGTDWIIGMQVGADVTHAHIILFPRHEDDGHGSLIDEKLKKTYTPEEFEVFAQKIREAL